MSVHFEAYPLAASGCGATTSNRHKQTRVLLVGESSSTSIAILVKHSRLQFRKRRRENAAVRNWMDQRHVSHKTHTVCFFSSCTRFPERKKRRWLRPDKNTIRKKEWKRFRRKMCSSLAVRPMQFDASIFFFRLDGCVFLILFKSEAGSENRTNARRTHTERERGVQYYMCAVAPSLAQWGVSSSSSSCPGKIYFLKKGNVYPKRRRRVIRLQRRAHFFCFFF